MKEIILTQNKVALVDDADYEWLNQWKWTYHLEGYAYRGWHDGKRQTVYMHNLIMNAKGIDHIDDNGLNNQKHNLRLATRKQNARNRSATKNSATQVKGLFWHKSCSNWRGQIKCEGKVYTKSSKDKSIVEQWLINKREELHKDFARH